MRTPYTLSRNISMSKEQNPILKGELATVLIEVRAHIKEIDPLSEAITPDLASGDPELFEFIKVKQDYRDDLKRSHVKEKKILWIQQLMRDGEVFICRHCQKEIECERLLHMPKSAYCSACTDKIVKKEV